MAKKKLVNHTFTTEDILYHYAIEFLQEKGPTKKEDFSDVFLKWLKENGRLESGDLITNKDAGKKSRHNELTISVKIRNLYSSHKTLIKYDEVKEEDGVFILCNETKENSKSIFENQIYYGPPGTGKTYSALNCGLHEADKTVIQFHPSYTYEHFVQGERLVSLGNERTTQIVDGPLMVAFRKATNTPAITKCLVRFKDDKAYLTFPSGMLAKYEIDTPEDLDISFDFNEDTEVFFTVDTLTTTTATANKDKIPGIDSFFDCEIVEVKIRNNQWAEKTSQLIVVDEINRADSAMVFGELLNAMAAKNSSSKKNRVKLQYSGEEFYWPDNMKLIGTMNSADRSIGEIDQAMKRRFRIIEFPPQIELLRSTSFKHLKSIKRSLGSKIETSELSTISENEISSLEKSYDALVDFYNKCLLVYGDEFALYRIPLPSYSLENLHTALYENAESIFALKRKLVGHSFHMEFVDVLWTNLEPAVDSGFPYNRESVQELGKDVKLLHENLIQHEMKPQIESIAMDNEKLVDKIMKTWRSLNQEHLHSRYGAEDKDEQQAS